MMLTFLIVCVFLCFDDHRAFQWCKKMPFLSFFSAPPRVSRSAVLLLGNV